MVTLSECPKIAETLSHLFIKKTKQKKTHEKWNKQATDVHII